MPISTNSLALIREMSETVIREEYPPDEASRILSGEKPSGSAPTNAACLAVQALDLVEEVRRLLGARALLDEGRGC